MGKMFLLMAGVPLFLCWFVAYGRKQGGTK